MIIIKHLISSYLFSLSLCRGIPSRSEEAIYIVCCLSREREKKFTTRVRKRVRRRRRRRRREVKWVIMCVYMLLLNTMRLDIFKQREQEEEESSVREHNKWVQVHGWCVFEKGHEDHKKGIFLLLLLMLLLLVFLRGSLTLSLFVRSFTRRSYCYWIKKNFFSRNEFFREKLRAEREREIPSHSIQFFFACCYAHLTSLVVKLPSQSIHTYVYTHTQSQGIDVILFSLCVVMFEGAGWKCVFSSCSFLLSLSLFHPSFYNIWKLW